MKTLAALLVIFACCPALLAQHKPDVEYARAGDVSLKLDAATPEGPGPFPVIIIVHGGGWTGGDKTKDIDPLFKPLTSAGYVWFSVNYRLAPDHRWPACINDVKTAVRWVRAHAAEFKGDPNRVAILGHSAGGQLAFLAALDPDLGLKAAVGLAPVTDMEIDLESRGGLSKSLQALLDRPQKIDDQTLALLQQLQPIKLLPPNTSKLPPFLLLQGSADKTVWPKQSENFVARVQATGGKADLQIIREGQHRVTDWDKYNVPAEPTWTDKLLSWLAGHL